MWYLSCVAAERCVYTRFKKKKKKEGERREKKEKKKNPKCSFHTVWWESWVRIQSGPFCLWPRQPLITQVFLWQNSQACVVLVKHVVTEDYVQMASGDERKAPRKKKRKKKREGCGNTVLLSSSGSEKGNEEIKKKLLWMIYKCGHFFSGGGLNWLSQKQKTNPPPKKETCRSSMIEPTGVQRKIIKFSWLLIV